MLIDQLEQRESIDHSNYINNRLNRLVSRNSELVDRHLAPILRNQNFSSSTSAMRFVERLFRSLTRDNQVNMAISLAIDDRDRRECLTFCTHEFDHSNVSIFYLDDIREAPPNVQRYSSPTRPICQDQCDEEFLATRKRTNYIKTKKKKKPINILPIHFEANITSALPAMLLSCSFDLPPISTLFIQQTSRYGSPADHI